MGQGQIKEKTNRIETGLPNFPSGLSVLDLGVYGPN